MNAPAKPPTAGFVPRKVFIKTYGCQMNVYDSQRMGDVLTAEGYETAGSPDDADLIVVNTCHIREKAAEKLYSQLGRLRAIKKRRQDAGKPTQVAVAGCVAQAEGSELVSRAPVVDLVIGPQAYHRLPEYLERASRGESVVATDFSIEEKFATLPAPTERSTRARGVSAYLTVQEGCDKFCTFCVVPYTRGAEVSRPVSQILEEANRLSGMGVREITLLGQNVNAWHGLDSGGRRWRLGELIDAIARIETIARIRYTTSHPIDLDQALIEAHRDQPKLMPYLHLPAQSGSDRVLKAMNRRHGAEYYLGLIERVRAARPDIAISGDFIVGFPGESEAEFDDTLRLAASVGYASAYSFKYSPRPGTPGADMANQVPEPVKADRLARLHAVLQSQHLAFNLGCVGREMDVLVEKFGRQPGQLACRSHYLQTVFVAAPDAEIGDLMRVSINGAGPNSLAGALPGELAGSA